MSDDPRLGRTIASGYTPFEILGEGGCATVYRALQHSMGREVALKLLRRDTMTTDAEAVKQFVSEAKLVSRLGHPNIVTVIDVGLTDEGELFLVMERLHGRTLRDILRREAPLSLERAVAIASQICDALEATHRQQVIHCDLKPENVFVLAGAGRLGEHVKLIDFGIARALDAPDLGPSSTPGVVFGTPAYLAPEQAQGADVDGRADLYALGCVLFEMLSGQLPFVGATPLDVVRAKLRSEPPRLSSLQEGISPVLDELLLRVLSRSPAARPGTALELRDELLQLVPERGVMSRRRLRLGASLLRTNLPVDEDIFIGRDQELAILSRSLEAGRALVTITGPGGMGKTRMAIRAGLRWLQRWGHPDRSVTFCQLSTALSLEMACLEVSRALGENVEASDVDLVDLVGRSLAARGPLLLILDDVDHLAESLGDVLERWLVVAPELCVLATSSRRLKSRSETAFELGPLSLPRSGAELASSAAVRLFVERAREAGVTVPLDGEGAGALGELVERLDGMPLAIELAAARTTILTPAQILAKLDDRFRLLTGRRARRQSALRHTIEWSWSLLDPREQCALAQLSVFRGGFSPEAVASVVDLETFGGGPDAVDVVAALRDSSFLRIVEVPGEPEVVRWDLYESIRAFAAAALEELGDAEAARARHAEHFLLVGALWADDIADRDDTEARRCLDREVENLLAVHRRALAREPRTAADVEQAIRALLAVDPLLARRGLMHVYFRWLEEARTLAESFEVAPATKARLSTAWASMLGRNGRWERACGAYEASLALAREVGDRRLEAACLTGLGIAWASRQEPARALEHLAAAREPVRELGAARQLCELEKATGLAHYSAGEYRLALAAFQRGAALAEREGFPLERAVALHNFGDAAARIGHYARSLDALERSQAIVDAHGFGRLREFNDLLIGCVEAQMTGRPEAVTRVERILEAARALGNNWMVVQVAFFLGRAHLALGNVEAAKVFFLESLEVARGDDNRAYIRDAEQALAELDVRVS